MSGTEAPSHTVDTVEHHASASQFEIRSDAGTALLRYSLKDGAIDLLHTEVPEACEGRGYGGALVRAALDYARGEGLRVIPTCPFVRKFVKRYPEYADLLASA